MSVAPERLTNTGSMSLKNYFRNAHTDGVKDSDAGIFSEMQAYGRGTEEKQ